MIEVEIKLPVENGNDIGRKLLQIGFRKSKILTETDTYFDKEDGFIKKNGLALRVRITEDMRRGRTEAVITFKGQKMDAVSMTRRELESGIEKPEVMVSILQALGYREASPRVRKLRQEYVSGHMTASLDRVEGLGEFLELEIICSETSGKDHALHEIEMVLNRLGYVMEDTVTTSYLSMIQKAGIL